MYVSIPNRIAPIRPLPTSDAAITGRTIRSIGRIGSAARCSRITNRTRNATEATSSPVAIAIPCCEPSRTSSSRQVRPPESSPAPAQSIGATLRSTKGSVTYHASITIATMANGTLTRKTQRQPTLSVR